MPKFVIEVAVYYHDIVVETDTLEDALELAKMGVVDRWPDEIEATAQIQFRPYKHMDNGPIDPYLGC